MSKKALGERREALAEPVPEVQPPSAVTSGVQALPTRKQKVFAGPCPRNADHKSTRVYRTDGRTRYCVCDDCGETWKRVGPPVKAEGERQKAE